MIPELSEETNDICAGGGISIGDTRLLDDIKIFLPGIWERLACWEAGDEYGGASSTK